MLSPTELNEKKEAFNKAVLGLEMKAIAYADSCRDSNNDPEYAKAISTVNNIQAIVLN